MNENKMLKNGISFDSQISFLWLLNNIISCVINLLLKRQKNVNWAKLFPCFCLHLCYLVPQDEILFVDFLQSKRLSSFFVPNKVDGAVSPVWNELDGVEVVFRRLLDRRVLALLLLTVGRVLVRQVRLRGRRPLNRQRLVIVTTRDFGQSVQTRQIILKFCQRISVESQFSDDVLRNVSRHSVDTASLPFGSFEELVKLFRIEFETFKKSGRTGHDQKKLLDQRGQVTGGFRRFFACLKKIYSSW